MMGVGEQPRAEECRGNFSFDRRDRMTSNTSFNYQTYEKLSRFPAENNVKLEVTKRFKMSHKPKLYYRGNFPCSMNVCEDKMMENLFFISTRKKNFSMASIDYESSAENLLCQEKSY